MASIFEDAKQMARDPQYKERVIAAASQDKRANATMQLYCNIAVLCANPDDANQVCARIDEERRFAFEAWMQYGEKSRKIANFVNVVDDKGRSNAFDNGNRLQDTLRMVSQYHHPEREEIELDYSFTVDGDNSIAFINAAQLQELKALDVVKGK